MNTKWLSCALGLCLLAGLARSDGIITSQVRRFMENFRNDMRCGVPELGLPVLAPLNLPTAELDMQLPGLSLRGTVLQLHVPDLDTFIIRDINVNMILLRMDFTLHYPLLRASGNFHQVIGQLPGSCRINGNGRFAVQFRDTTIQMAMRMQLRGLNIQLGPMQTTVTVQGFQSQIEHFEGGAGESERCNRQLEQSLPQLIRANQVLISEQVDEMVRPEVNEFLREMRLQDLLDLIAAGTNPTPCSRLAEAERRQFESVYNVTLADY